MLDADAGLSSAQRLLTALLALIHSVASHCRSITQWANHLQDPYCSVYAASSVVTTRIARNNFPQIVRTNAFAARDCECFGTTNVTPTSQGHATFDRYARLSPRCWQALASQGVFDVIV